MRWLRLCDARDEVTFSFLHTVDVRLSATSIGSSLLYVVFGVR